MPHPRATAVGEQYSPYTGLAYVFNLIVGTGALTLPAAFASTGWLLSAIVIILLACFSYITAGWMVEAMACANALNHWKRVKLLKKRGHVPDELVSRTLENAAESSSVAAVTAIAEASTDKAQRLLQDISPLLTDQDDEILPSPAEATGLNESSDVEDVNSGTQLSDSMVSSEDQEETLLIQGEVIERTVGDYYVIQERVEMGEMAKLFYGKNWVRMFFLVLCIYLYGDMAIYEAAIAKSVRDIVCNYVPENCTQELQDSDLCFENKDYLRIDIYRICVGVFVGLMGPFVFFNLSKTKYMQICTAVIRWIAMLVMISWAVAKIASQSSSHITPPVARFTRLPDLFGVCVYCFMCHHSLPSLITPINNKRSLYTLLAGDYLLILLFYLLLAFTGIFAFVRLEDLYTLNFQPDPCTKGQPLTFLYCVQIFLLLFPVFTLSTNFPIIAITLRNNLKGLFLRETRRYSFFTTRLLFPLLAVIPPTAIALFTSNVEFLVNITGAYAGSVVQYVVPASLVLLARRKTLQRIGMGVRNPFQAPVQSNWYLYLIGTWTVLCWIFVSVYLAQGIS